MGKSHVHVMLMMAAIGAAAIGCSTLLAGCQFKGSGVEAPAPTMEDYWWPQPSALRVYPSTRFVEDERSAAPILEARIELRDEMGDAVKGAGTAALELFAASDEGQGLGQQLQRWEVTMSSLEDQQRHFDSVTRTYLFRLRLDASARARGDRLRVTFTRASDGRRLQTESRIR